MQQKVCSGGSLSFHDGTRSPFFRSLDTRAACPHEYDGFSITGKFPACPPHKAGLPAARGVRRSLSDGRDAAHFLISRRRTRSVGTRQDGDQDEERGETDEEDGTSDKPPDHHSGFHLGPAPLLGHHCCSDPDGAWSLSAAGHGGLGGIGGDVGSGDGCSVLQQRLARVRTELAQADTRLLCERAHSQHLSRERQEVAEKERSLSRQVDVAVMVIAALKEQINASESELERRERQVLSIQKFLEMAARQETSGKVRIQLFIENLLRRIALAETLLEDYQGRQTPATDRDKPLRITKSRSAGCQLSCGLHGNAPSGEQRERLARSSRLFCRPEHRVDIWNQRRRSTGYEA
ncbi:uncharacterized protein znf365 [Hippocampus comes]|uniref:uncharacterized protein znf365 n=1 Tax=Hippocampus comes TaxID=109280 RepID=UPI00094E673A|nr:PREDICTED: uncharacterized protein LOC109510051 [Hippocampus comes]XP_019715647.1 PREDICTED: uncharacterized protein LOC109510051 [Hippocampus comes]XP_019715648.1 PREDICTED: uncharacterized protein LOC109510051 [Hippocampus comes]